MRFKNGILRDGQRTIAEGLRGEIHTTAARGRPQPGGHFLFEHNSSAPQLLIDLTATPTAVLELPGLFKCRVAIQDAAGNFKICGAIELLEQ